MEDLLFGFLVFCVAFALALLTATFLWRLPVRPRGWRWIAVHGAHAFGCLVLVLLLNGVPGYFGENADVYARLSLVPGGSTDPAPRPFLLIDNSRDKQLVPDPDGNMEDSSVLVITHRARLARLLTRLAQEQAHIAQVVVDIAFTDPSPADSALRESILALAAQRKIMIARTPLPNTPLLSFGSDVMADATERTQEGLIAWHSIVRDGEPSLPYALYLRLNDRASHPFFLSLHRERPAEGPGLVYAGFMPTWKHLPAAHNAEEETGMDDMAMPIGHALDAGWARLSRQLHEATSVNAPVVFIGEFPDAPGEVSVDRQRTFLGEETGSSLLIDLYHEIEDGTHRVDPLSLIICFVVLFGCTWGVFRMAWKRSPETPPGSFGGIVRKFLMDRIEDLVPVIILLITAYGLREWAGRQMNLVPLMIYFVMLIGLAKAMARLRIREMEAKARTMGGHATTTGP